MGEAWRIIKGKHAASAFTGEGAAKFGGRWNSRGVPIVYASATLALAALETLVHLNPGETFPYKIFQLEFEDRLVERFVGELPDDWRTEPPPVSTRGIGDNWIRRATSPILRVPSAIIPLEFNLLLNPAHPEFREIAIGKPLDFAFDRRLV
jgi:RES domain-containing protein